MLDGPLGNFQLVCVSDFSKKLSNNSPSSHWTNQFSGCPHYFRSAVPLSSNLCTSLVDVASSKHRPFSRRISLIYRDVMFQCPSVWVVFSTILLPLHLPTQSSILLAIFLPCTCDEDIKVNIRTVRDKNCVRQ